EFLGSDRDGRLSATKASLAILDANPEAAEMGLAVDAGKVYRGPVRIGEENEITVFGAAVNRAAKTAARESGLVILSPLEEALALQLKALGLALDADGRYWRPAHEPRSPGAAVAQTSSGKLVGRELELEVLVAAQDAAQTGVRAVLVHGPAGLGKTALV